MSDTDKPAEPIVREIVDVSPQPPKYEKRYLGDGVYADCDGYQIWLRTERYGMIHEIAIEPSVLAALNDYARALKGTV